MSDIRKLIQDLKDPELKLTLSCKTSVKTIIVIV
ncbi:hypothetical protein EYZ11_013365 [Aspergillus tanneri]|uniref:Uncharacterized protein n=1 Tax=Aspergillus tanneri TaxID=1220188 RepID=A0A4S3IXU5_9EURO|nr:hypothetical protein EYZ11_013365 [Aspergillus tanneri]